MENNVDYISWVKCVLFISVQTSKDTQWAELVSKNQSRHSDWKMLYITNKVKFYSLCKLIMNYTVMETGSLRGDMLNVYR